MLRIIRISFLVLLGLVLATISMANREAVTLRLLPSEVDAFFGFQTSVQIPLFLIIAGGIVAGLLIGFVWEWIREARIRNQADRAQREVQQLQKEVKTLKGSEKGSSDDVLALLE